MSCLSAYEAAVICEMFVCVTFGKSGVCLSDHLYVCLQLTISGVSVCLTCDKQRVLLVLLTVSVCLSVSVEPVSTFVWAVCDVEIIVCLFLYIIYTSIGLRNICLSFYEAVFVRHVASQSSPPTQNFNKRGSGDVNKDWRTPQLLRTGSDSQKKATNKSLSLYNSFLCYSVMLFNVKSCIFVSSPDIHKLMDCL